ncbi:MAG: hypothetical protein JO257_09600, partial [Deltaproteobacteria bacterium]|nr:hypothetical protein [Deltaproteobacteria bacterium]
VAPAKGAVKDPMAGPCKLSVHHDEYRGFSIGYPRGWRIDYGSGTVVVSNGAHEGALVFPARMRRADVPPEYLGAQVAYGLAAQIRGAGGTFELVDMQSDGRIASATAIATIDGVRVRGALEVIASPGFMTLQMYWAPETELARETPTLHQVIACFKRDTLITKRAPVAPPGGPVTHVGGADAPKPAVPQLQAYRGRFFTLGVPTGWRLLDENEHGIDLVANDLSMAMGFGWVLGPIYQTADVVAQQTVAQYYQGMQIVSARWEPAPAGWQVATIEMAGSVNGGPPLRGIVRVAIGGGVMLTGMWTATSAKWPTVRPMLEAMIQSVQIQPAAVAQVGADVRQQLASYPPVHSTYTPMTQSSSTDVMSGWEAQQSAQDRAAQGYDDALLGQDRARSPSTGESYVVPNTAWNATGPQGAGYYRALPGGGAERLDVQGTDY